MINGIKTSGSGFVTRFAVNSEFIKKYPVQTVGASIYKEFWVPAEELEEFNSNIIGKIEVITEFYSNP